MNQIINSSIGEVSIDRNKIKMNGKEYEIPKYIDTSNISIINNEVFVSGYEFKNEEWKRTLRALWHKYF